MSDKTTVLLLIATLSLVSGAVGGAFATGIVSASIAQPLQIVLVLLSTLLVFAWYRLDSDARGYRRSLMLNAGVIGMSALALPYYFFRSRGFKGGLLATVLCALTLVGMMSLTVVGGVAAMIGT